MSSTPVRRNRPAAARPRARVYERAPRIAEALPAEIPQEQERARTSPFERAFPIPRLSADVLIAGGLILVSLLLRLWALGDRPLHHDESLHATYSWYLMGRSNPEYHYDPMMHGPLQFHMIAFFYSILGSSPFAARLWSVATGTALVVAPLLLRRQLGRPVTYTLMAIFSLSPSLLYFSRFAREDMQFGFFTFMIVASLIRFLVDRQEESPYHYRWLYLLSASFILAYSGKESIYLVTAILLAFLGAKLCMELVRGAWWAGPAVGALVMAGGLGINHLALAAVGALIIAASLIVLLWSGEGGGQVADAIRATPGSAWALSAAIIVVLFVLLYWPIGDPATWGFQPNANPVKTTLEIPGLAKAKPFTYSTDGLIGGLLYWQAQEPVARGGQPWFYYLLIIPLYEWLPVLFGIIGGAYLLLRQRTLVPMLLVWWTVATFLIYGWSSEKMPWNAIHLVIPLSVLAAIGLVAGVMALRRWVRYLAIAGVVLTGFITVHNSVTLAYVNGASPHEYYVYVQTTQDVPNVLSEMERVRAQLKSPMPVMVDTEETWPWVFYLRDNTHWSVNYASSAAAYGVPSQPILLVSDANYPALKSTLSANYVAFEERLRIWNPEEYKADYVLRSDANGNLLSRRDRFLQFVKDAASPSTWGNIMQWEIARQPFSPHAWDNYSNSANFYFVVQRGYVKDLSPAYQQRAKDQLAAQQAADPFLRLGRSLNAGAVFGTGGTGTATIASVGPIALDARGRLLVGDLTNHRVQVLTGAGAQALTIGSAGSGPGQFKSDIGGIAVGPNGNIYATDTWNHRVQEFDANGAFIRAWGRQNLNLTGLKPGDFYGPRGIAVDPNGRVYVADTGHERIQVFDANGVFLFTFGTHGPDLGQLNEPSSVTIGPDGKIYVADSWNQRIQIFDAQGHALRQFKVVSWQSGSYAEPHIAVDAAGRVYVPDALGGRIMVYSPAGLPLLAWGSAGNGPNQFTNPSGVTLGPGNTVWVADSGNSRVQRFSLP